MNAKSQYLPLVLQIAGAADVVLGVAVAALGPGLVGGGDATVEAVLIGAGAFLAAGGAAMWAWGRFRLSPRDVSQGPRPSA